MTLSQTALDEVQRLIAADADLQARLQGADDAVQAVAMIVDAAVAKGLQVEPEELSSHLAVAAEALNDAQLEAVAGGIGASDRRTAIETVLLSDANIVQDVKLDIERVDVIRGSF